MSRYTIAEARNNLPSVVHEAEEKGPVELTRRGEPVAVVLSIAEYQMLLGRPDFFETMMEFRREHAADLDDEPGLPERDRSPGREKNPWL